VNLVKMFRLMTAWQPNAHWSELMQLITATGIVPCLNTYRTGLSRACFLASGSVVKLTPTIQVNPDTAAYTN
jgi:hypothetical protein